MALNATAPAWVVQCADSWALSLLAYGLIPSHSTFPHDPPERGISIALDSQLVAARSHMRCRHMNADCFQPPAVRHCAAQADGKEGCACDTPACQDHCRLATPRDPEAAYVYYKGSNQTPGAPPPPANGAATDTPAAAPTGRGKHHFGYKSKAFNVLDDRLFTYWPLAGPYAAADRNDHLQTVPGFQELRRRFPKLTIGEVSADAGEGYDAILTYVHDDLRALRLIDQRAAKDDAAPLTCLTRGYDAQGVPLCPHGYRLAFNGHDYVRGDSKWACRQRCRRQLRPDIRPPNAQPEPTEPASQDPAIAACPYRDLAQPVGRVIRVGLTLPDGSIRLARDLPVASPSYSIAAGPPELRRKPQCRPGTPPPQTLALVRLAQQRQGHLPGRHPDLGGQCRPLRPRGHPGPRPHGGHRRLSRAAHPSPPAAPPTLTASSPQSCRRTGDGS